MKTRIPSFSIFLIPLALTPLHLSCKNNATDKVDIKILEKIAKYSPEESQQNEAKEILEEIKKLPTNWEKNKNNAGLIKKINTLISNFNSLNKQEFYGLIIEKVAINQDANKASTVVSELIKANNFNEATKIFKKYSIVFDQKDVNEKDELKISPTTHAHDDLGIIHLEISFKLANQIKRYEIIGFKKE